jgi:Ca2+-binding EF-hand superfamily protein
LGAPVSRYELRAIWRRIDADGSGQASLAEFTRFVYCVELQSWPDLQGKELERCVGKLNAAAEKWHHAGGNWFKIFNAIDADGSGNLSYDELQQCVRGPWPGLRLQPAHFPEVWVQGLWKALDDQGEMIVPVHRFMAFMRQHGAAYSIHKLTSYSKKMRGLEEMKEDLQGEVVPRTPAQLRTISGRLEDALRVYIAAKTEAAQASPSRSKSHSRSSDGGTESHSMKSVKALWSAFLEAGDADRSGKINYDEFLRTVIELAKLTSTDNSEQGQVGVAVGIDDLRTLWKKVLDPDGDGELSHKMLAYRLGLLNWPEALSHAGLERVVDKIDEAVTRRHRATGNWYKVFNLADQEGTGHMHSEELMTLVRDQYRGLGITPNVVSDKDLKSLWRALDDNASGDITVMEFMHFMRKHSKNNMSRLTEYSQKSRHLAPETPDYSKEIAGAPELGPKEQCAVATCMTLLVHAWLSRRFIRCDTDKPRIWSQLISYVNSKKSSSIKKGLRDNDRIDYTGYMYAAKEVLQANQSLSDDELTAFWRSVDEDGSGECSSAEFDRAVYRSQLGTWPELEATQIQRIVKVMNSAADHWHRAGGNWYKVFVACDEDGSGNMEFRGANPRGAPLLSGSRHLTTEAQRLRPSGLLACTRQGLLGRGGLQRVHALHAAAWQGPGHAQADEILQNEARHHGGEARRRTGA